jgi:hypothetical protein
VQSRGRSHVDWDAIARDMASAGFQRSSGALSAHLHAMKSAAAGGHGTPASAAGAPEDRVILHAGGHEFVHIPRKKDPAFVESSSGRVPVGPEEALDLVWSVSKHTDAGTGRVAWRDVEADMLSAGHHRSSAAFAAHWRKTHA